MSGILGIVRRREATIINPAQIHLALNHIPLALVLVGAPMMAVALFKSLQQLKKAAYLLLVLAGIFVVPVFFSGEPTETLVKQVRGIDEANIHEHEEAAEFAVVLVGALGAVSLVAWFLEHRGKVLPKSVGWALCFFSFFCLSVLLRTGHLGGLVHHEEIRSTFTPSGTN